VTDATDPLLRDGVQTSCKGHFDLVEILFDAGSAP